MNLSDAIKKVVEGKSLSREEARDAMNAIMSGESTQAQIGSYITALRMKGEIVDEIAGSAEAMREHAGRIDASPEFLVDTCGTGGDGAHTINVSTLAGLIAAGAGVQVAKHGNRAVSSKCGSADVLKELGVRIDAEPEAVKRCLDKANIGFFFAPLWHGAMKHAIGPRREIGIRTIFNILGPLCNPAGARRQVLGVFNPDLTEVMAGVLKELGSTHVWVVHGSDGLDEITISGPTRVTELRDGEIKTFNVYPMDVGVKESSLEKVRGGDTAQNAKIVNDVLSGWKGPCRDISVLNAAAAILVGGKAGTIEEGVEKARESIDTGNAAEALKTFVTVSNQ
jgi:anthranilate phosphoribosyltransferase